MSITSAAPTHFCFKLLYALVGMRYFLLWVWIRFSVIRIWVILMIIAFLRFSHLAFADLIALFKYFSSSESEAKSSLTYSFTVAKYFLSAILISLICFKIFLHCVGAYLADSISRWSIKLSVSFAILSSISLQYSNCFWFPRVLSLLLPVSVFVLKLPFRDQIWRFVFLETT